MDNELKYRKDKATVISIIKYALFAIIAVAVAFSLTKIIILLIPFLIGFILAKVSLIATNSIFKIKNKKADDTQPYVPTKQEKDPELTGIRKFFFQPKKNKTSTKTKVALVIYVVILLLALSAIISLFILLIVQLNKLLILLPSWLASNNVGESITLFLSNLSVENGGFLPVDTINSIEIYIADLQSTITDSIPDLVSSALSAILGFIGNVPLLFFYVIVMIMSGFYFLVDNRQVFQFLSRNIKSRSFRHKSITLINNLSSTLFRVIGGYLLLLIITFVEAFFFFIIAGVNYAIILALVAAVLDFMPVLGVSATLFPLIAVMIFQGNYGSAIILVIAWIVINIVRRFVEPPILGGAMHMHPMATLFAMILGVAIWGVGGFLIGPLVVLVSIEIAKEFSIDKKLREFAENVLNKLSQD